MYVDGRCRGAALDSRVHTGPLFLTCPCLKERRWFTTLVSAVFQIMISCSHNTDATIDTVTALRTNFSIAFVPTQNTCQRDHEHGAEFIKKSEAKCQSMPLQVARMRRMATQITA